jgi:CheY-like chemotaxis protein
LENSSFSISTSEKRMFRSLRTAVRWRETARACAKPPGFCNRLKGPIAVDTGSGKKKVLVIDDEETILTMVKSQLGQDYEVITANSGQQALDLFSGGLVPDLVLLDLNMPEMDGWDTFTRIRAIGIRTPIAIYTTSEESEDKSRAREIGAVDFIKKPAKRTELLSRVGKLVSG